MPIKYKWCFITEATFPPWVPRMRLLLFITHRPTSLSLEYLLLTTDLQVSYTNIRPGAALTARNKLKITFRAHCQMSADAPCCVHCAWELTRELGTFCCLSDTSPGWRSTAGNVGGTLGVSLPWTGVIRLGLAGLRAGVSPWLTGNSAQRSGPDFLSHQQYTLSSVMIFFCDHY